jgi:hypothetical protein
MKKGRLRGGLRNSCGYRIIQRVFRRRHQMVFYACLASAQEACFSLGQAPAEGQPLQPEQLTPCCLRLTMFRMMAATVRASAPVRTMLAILLLIQVIIIELLLSLGS